MCDSVWLCDTTLRDGEQTPGVAFSYAEKAQIATSLSNAGIDELEVGVPSVGSDELDSIRRLVNLRLPARLTTWNRAVRSDLEASFQTGVSGVSISLPISNQHIQYKLRKSQSWAMEVMGECITLAKKEGKYVCLGLEDASRADMGFLLKIMKEAEKLKIDRIRLADTLGVLDPLEVFERFSPLVQKISTPLEFHAHNDLGMATANAIAAIKAGFKAISVTVGGLGERAGNAPLEEVAVAIRHVLNRPTLFDIRQVYSICTMLSEITRRDIPRGKPIVGSDVFTHTSAVHLDGMRKDKANYQSFPPESISREHTMVYGKYSGTKELVKLLNREEISFNQDQLTELLIRVRLLSSIRKTPLEVKDILPLINSYQ